jgi:uncharacterized membrane protein YdbT with pleckstrin-like domain
VESAFCFKCGAPVGSSSPTPAQTPGPSLTPPAPEPDSAEEELWRGRFSGKALSHLWFLWFLELVAVGYVWFTRTEETQGKLWAQILVGVLVLVPLLYIVWLYVSRKLSVRYRLTTHRLFRVRGILSRNHDEIELVRVDDVAVRQNLLQRVFNVGLITVIAPTDASEPKLELVGIENPIELKEQIRTHVRKRRARSLHVESH